MHTLHSVQVSWTQGLWDSLYVSRMNATLNECTEREEQKQIWGEGPLQYA
jgi:hypothetical protein